MSQIFLDCEGVEITMDDTIVLGLTVKVHDKRVENVLERCKKRNLNLNPGKIKLRQVEITYVGHRLT